MHRWIVALLLLTSGPLFAGTEALRLVPQPVVVTLAAQTPFTLGVQTDLALVLSGVSPGDLPIWRGRLAPWFSELAATVPFGATEERRAEFVLEYLHGKHLTRYQTYQTRLDTLIDKGTFNCVSSAVAYLLLARSLGLQVQAVATTSHAFCLVQLSDGREIDVETTNRHGFNPGTKSEFKDSFGETGFVYVPPGKYADRKTITERGLLGLIVQNRMAAWQGEGNLAACVGPAIDRWAMDPSPESRQTLIEGITNLAAENNSQRNYLAGLSLAQTLWDYLGPLPEVKNLVVALLNNHINVLLDKSDYSAALALATQWKNRDCLTPDQWTQISGVIQSSRLVSEVTNQPFTTAASSIEEVFAAGQITAARRMELLGVVYGLEVQRRASSGGNQAAWQFIDGLPDEIRRQTSMVKARDIYVYNWAVDIHNRFATLWNAKKYTEARALLTSALTLQPEQALLKKDLVLSQTRS